ncbi:Transcription antitermination protein NusG [Bradyrhizobium sp.]|uniref:transcription termination/antitermination protein NusG n=1 Tax=Bradyrhizobium sp. TaxID=376 RepID=UPI0007C1B017|nr:transcription termination/antitermination NusG family protein [Bradyrhizobium sp.]CUT12520.1 Transcription antitermination protein NusG [Bradyrhizobium sp.]
MNEPKQPVLLAIGDFAGFVEYVGKRRTKDQKQRWRLMQVPDRLYRSDMRLLEKLQVEIYQPLVRSIVFVPRDKLSHSQRRSVLRPTREKVEPFFPGYIFLTFPEDDERWREVFRMVRITGLVCAGGRPVEVKTEMIESIRAREIDGAVPSSTRLAELSFEIGENVRITDGPFAGFSAVVEDIADLSQAKLGDLTIDQLDESVRVGLLVSLFGRSSRVNLPAAQVEKV